jgi:hypothetical protein
MKKSDLIRLAMKAEEKIGVDRARGLKEVAFNVGVQTGELANKATFERYGKELFGVQKYWPITRTEPTKKKLRSMYSPIAHRGFSKKRKKLAKNPVNITGYFPKLYNSITDHAQYASLLNPVRNAWQFFEDSAWQTAVRDKFGQGTLDALNSYLIRVEDPSYYEIPGGDLMTTLHRKGVVSVIGMHLPVAVKQLVSDLLMLEDISAEAWIKGAGLSMEKAMQISKESIPQLHTRALFGRMTREVGDAATIGAARKAFLGRRSFNDLATGLIRGLDREVAIKHNIGSNMAQMEIDGWNEADPRYMAELRRRVNRTLVHNQPAWHPKDRSQIGGTKSPMIKFATAFHTQREAIVGMVNRANHQYKVDGDAKELLRKYGLILVSSALYSAVNEVHKITKKRDRNWKDYFEDFGLNLVQLPYFGEVGGALYKTLVNELRDRPRQDERVMDLLLFESVEHGFKAAQLWTKYFQERSTWELTKKGTFKHEDTMNKAVYETSQSLMLLLGIPRWPVDVLMERAKNEAKQYEVTRKDVTKMD